MSKVTTRWRLRASTRVAVAVGVITAATSSAQAASSEPLALVPVSAPKVDATTLTFLDEALASAAAKLLGTPVLDAAALADTLKPAQLRQLQRCENPRCYKPLEARLGLAALVGIRGVVSATGLVLSARLVRLSDGKVVARAQHTVALDPSAFGVGASTLLGELIATSRSVDATLLPAAGVAPAQPEVAANSAAVATPGPASPPQPAEVTPDVEAGFDYVPPPPPDLETLLAQTRPVDKVWNATWRPGVGFTIPGAPPTATSSPAGAVARMPTFAFDALDDSGVGVDFSYREYVPPGVTSPEAKEKGFGFNLLAGEHWRQRFDRVSSLLLFDMGLGYIPSTVKVMATDVGLRFGLLFHGMLGSRGQTLALGPYARAGGELDLFSVKTTDPAGVETTDTSTSFYATGQYGLMFRFRPAAAADAARPIFSFGADLYRDRIFSRWGTEIPVEPKAETTHLKLHAGVNVGNAYVAFSYATRVGNSDEFVAPTVAQLCAQQYGITITPF